MTNDNTHYLNFSMTPMKLGSYKYKTTYNHPPVTQDADKSSSHMISADDAEYPREYRTLGNGTRRFSNVGLVHTSERRHTVIAAQSLEALTGMQKSDMERKREAFLDHLKHKYPHHATAIRGQQERLREQQGFEAWSACEFRDGGNKIEAKVSEIIIKRMRTKRKTRLMVGRSGLLSCWEKWGKVPSALGNINILARSQPKV
ncbi:hypothetical protein scyTo_0004396 [Scyliorhinus torazame]|uniref:Uncharacterized protein n=1 Tax=Scyliorhinus torazame TaxID=75743 RepID=A0A401NR65_SCYTO|nr:hypothetical protein [Scyliorhinus torazame]